MDRESPQPISIDEALEFADNQQRVNSASETELESVLAVLKEENRNHSEDKNGGHSFSQHVNCSPQIRIIETRLRGTPKEI